MTPEEYYDIIKEETDTDNNEEEDISKKEIIALKRTVTGTDDFLVIKIRNIDVKEFIKLIEKDGRCTKIAHGIYYCDDNNILDKTIYITKEVFDKIDELIYE